MPIRKVVLTDHDDHLIETLLESGRYQDANEILSDGLRMVERRETNDAAKVEGLQAAARLGIHAFDRGDFREFFDAAQLVEHLDALAKPNQASVESK